jgi:Beta-galactosidase trimerisation domain
VPSWDAGAKRLVNPHFALTLEPRHGGRIVSLTTAGGELTTRPSSDDLGRSRVPYRFGLLSLQLWQDSYWHNDLCHREWPITRATVIPDRIQIALRGESIRWPRVSVVRTFTVTDDPWIDVGHQLDPGSETSTYLPPAFWFSNVLRERGRTFVPGPAGVLDYPRWPQDQSWCHEPTDGWMAWLRDARGLAFDTDPFHLRHVRVCHHNTDVVEWIRRRIGVIESSNVRLIPFSGPKRVDGVGSVGVVAVVSFSGELVVDVYALLTGVATLTLELVSPDGTATVFDSHSAALTAGSLSRITLVRRGSPIRPGPNGWWWRGRMSMSLPRGTFTTTFAIEDPGIPGLRARLPAAVHAAELARRTINPTKRQPPRSFNFDAAPVPLFQLNASPAPLPPPRARRRTDRLRVLAITAPENTAILLALAQQFDIDLTLPFVPRTAKTPTGRDGIAGKNFLHELGDRDQNLSGDELIAAWTAALSADRTYDVILLGINPIPLASDPATTDVGEGWGLLPQTLQAEILARVEAGAGLVVFRRGEPRGPNAESSTLEGLLPLDVVSTSDYHGPCHPADDRTVRGLPWTILPSPGRIFRFSPRGGAAVLVQIDSAGRLLPVLARTSHGAGRVLDLVWAPMMVPPDRYRERLPGTEGMDTLRYDLALVARILYDAARREPAIAVRNVTFADATATIELERAEPAAGAFDLDWVARDRFGLILGSGRESPRSFPASSVITISIPSGTWTVDAVIQPDVGEIGFGAGGRILDFAIAVAPDLTVLGREHTLEITPAGPASATAYIVDLLDGRGRVLERKRIAAGGRATMVVNRIGTPHAETRVHALDAAGRLVGQTLRQFRVRGRVSGAFWPIHFQNNYFRTASNLMLQQSLMVRHLDAQASMGISAYYKVSMPPRAQDDDIAAADRLAVPYVPDTGGWLVSRGGMTPGGSEAPWSLTDGEAIATGMQREAHNAAVSADSNVLYYKLADDEPGPPDIDVSHDARTLARFRAWLSDVYGYAESALREEWGATAAFATATPLALADTVARFSARDPTYAPWVDHRLFMMNVFSRAPAWAREALRRGDPEAATGTTGENWTGVHAGRDWWVRGRALDVVGRYRDSTAIEVKALGTRSIHWTGYDDPDPLIRYRVWNSLGLGEDGLGLFDEKSFLNPDFTLPEVGRDLAAALLPARRGVGGLFAASKPAEDGIFVLVSPESSAVLAIHGYEAPPRDPWTMGGIAARQGVHDILASMGVGWNAISPSDIETGALERSGARVLVLPMCAALSNAACEAIRRWVATGGCLIADLLPGSFTAHGKLRGAGISPTGAMEASTNPLDEVLGITPGVRPPITGVTVSVGGREFPIRCVDTALFVRPATVPGGAAAVAGGATAGGIPLWFQNAYQRGKAAYLACSLFADYPYESHLLRERVAWRDQRSRMEDAFSTLLQSLGVMPRARVVDATGVRVGLCQFRVRSIGPTELVALLRHYQGNQNAVAPEVDGELVFATPAHTYDIESGSYLGDGDRIRLRLGVYTFRAFARLPYRVQSVSVEIVGRAPRLGDSINVLAKLSHTAGHPPHGHRFRLDVLAGNRPLRYLAREAMAECGIASFTISSAFNDPPGIWTIVVTDVATGVQGRRQVDMGARARPIPEPDPFQLDAIYD